MDTNTYPQESTAEDLNRPIDLADLRDPFSGSEVQDRQFDAVPDGKYQVNIDRVELTRSKNSGTPMFRWVFRILGPQQRGRLLWKNSVLTRDSMKWFKTDLHAAGLDLEQLTDLNDRMGELLNVKLEIVKKTNGEYENVYINRRIVMDDDSLAGPGAAPSDGVPF